MLGAAITALGLFFVFAPNDAPEIDFAPVDVGGGSLTFPEQTRTTEVTFSTTLVKTGFVTIHQAIGLAPGPVVAISSPLTPGEYVDVTLAVPDGLTPGLPYIALLLVDDGDGVYESDWDFPVTTGGSVVRADFRAPGESVLIPE